MKKLWRSHENGRIQKPGVFIKQLGTGSPFSFHFPLLWKTANPVHCTFPIYFMATPSRPFWASLICPKVKSQLCLWLTNPLHCSQNHVSKHNFRQYCLHSRLLERTVFLHTISSGSHLSLAHPTIEGLISVFPSAEFSKCHWWLICGHPWMPWTCTAPQA